MDEPQRKLIDQVDADGRLVVWPECGRLCEVHGAPIVVEGSEHVGVVPRAIPGDDAAPVVVHLLNRQYNGEKDAMVPQEGFTLRLRDDLAGGRRFTKATLHAPREDPIELPVNTDREQTVVTIPKLALWAILALDD